MSAVLTIEQLQISYRNENAIAEQVLRNLDLHVENSEILGIFGDSGSGKTTLARGIVRMLPPTASVEGSVQYRGTNLLALPIAAMRQIRGGQIGLVPQEPSTSLNPFVKAGKQVEEVVHAHRSLSGELLREQARKLLEFFFPDDVHRIANRYPHQLSGGERQRIVICQALAGGASLLLADEPTSSMDSIAQKAFLDLLAHLRQSQGISIILISHNRAALRYVADRSLELREGRLSS